MPDKIAASMQSMIAQYCQVLQVTCALHSISDTHSPAPPATMLPFVEFFTVVSLALIESTVVRGAFRGLYRTRVDLPANREQIG